MKKVIAISLLTLLFGVSSKHTLQAQQHVQHPIGYSSLQALSQMGSFSFAELDRNIVTTKTATYYSPEPISLTFEILVAPNGDVKYVRAPKLSSTQQELRLACTSALYGFAFAPVSSTVGEKWYKATLVPEED